MKLSWCWCGLALDLAAGCAITWGMAGKGGNRFAAGHAPPY
jgi:hypothetical protein